MRIFTHFTNRRTEWILAVYTLGFGMWLLLPPTSLNPSSFSPALRMMTEGQWGLAYSFVGFLHCLALHINGRAAWTPFGRLFAVFLNCQVFLALTVGLIPANPFGSGVYTYGFLGIGFCGVCLIAAAVDCGKEFKIWRGRNGSQR